mgnify:CR=1 FL=1
MLKETRSRLAWVISAAGLIAVVGCERGDPRIKDLTTGIGKDSVQAVMDGPPTTVEPYLVNGQYIEGLFYPRPGKSDSASRQPRQMTPVVLIDAKLVGWGWDFWDSLAAANRIPVPEKP